MGHFFILGVMNKMDSFSKKPTTAKEQVGILQQRGMLVADSAHAMEFLDYCSYYRFCGYALHFERLTNTGERTHSYKPGTTFEAVERIYHFDAALRRLMFHYTTLIEVNFRASFSNISAQFYNDAHWFMNPVRFLDSDKHTEFLQLCQQEVKRSREIFITSYKSKYTTPDLPPIWMLTELMSFSVWSKLYQNLADKSLKQQIANALNVPEKYLISWLQALTVLRNLCAHHSRIWNRNFTQAPLLSNSMKKKVIPTQHKKIFALLLVIYDLLKTIKREKDFYSDLTDLFSQYPEIDLRNLGFATSPSVIVR